jgi:predicted permease
MLLRLLLLLYPASFRSEYGAEIARVFAARRRDADGPFAIFALWMETIADTVTAAIPAHWDILRQDLVYTSRTLRRSPGFAATAVLVTALGIGATTAAFTLADHVLLRPLPFPEPDRLVKIWEDQGRIGYSRSEPSPANFHDWQRMATSFESMGAYSSVSINLGGTDRPERLDGAAVTAGLLEMLGARPAVGRLFTATEDTPESGGTVLLSDALWRSRYGADFGVLGRTILLDDEPHTIVGIMPPEFRFPNREVAFWKTERFSKADLSDRSNSYLRVIGRLRRGVSFEQARAEMKAVAAQLERQWPKENQGVGANIGSLRDEVGPRSRWLLIALAGAAVCVLLIGCTNLANLLLARGMARRREMSVRAAIGAGRERLVRQLLTESLVLSAIGGSTGVAMALAALPLLVKLVPTSLPIAETPQVDLRVLSVAAVLSCFTGIAFGVAPALRASTGRHLEGLREGMREGGGQRERLRASLVVAEVALSVVLLVSAGLLMRALLRLQTVDPGFRPEGVLTLRTSLPMPKYNATALRRRFYNDVLSRTRALPGVTGAAYTSFVPMSAVGGIWQVEVPGRDPGPTQRQAMLRFVTPGFFSAMGIPQLLGRDVSETDTRESPFTAVVSESFARRYWPGENPLGRHFKFCFFARTIVGVVRDVRARGVERESEPQVYLPYQQVPDGWVIWYAPKDLVVRAVSPSSLIPALRRIVSEADPAQPVSDVRLMTEIVEAETSPRLVQVRVLGGFAAVAFLLAAIGIHGLLSYTVSTRAREIGVRMALGAQRRDILAMIAGSGARMALAGIVLGSVLAYAAGGALQSLLAGVSPSDQMAFGGAIGLCLVTAAAGSLIPAVRAMRLDPSTVIKAE